MSDPTKLIPSNTTELFTTRLIFLMECSPQSNHYHQIMLNKEQFKKMSDALHECAKKNKNCNNCGNENCISLELDADNEYKLADDIKVINEDNEPTTHI